MSEVQLNLSMDELKQLTEKDSIEKSESINELASALSKAQLSLESAKKGSSGYGYNYSDLATVIETSKKPLSDNGLSVTQLLGDGVDDKVSITTVLMHSSGQYISSRLELEIPDMKGVNDSQRRGAAYSYGRRYALQAILNMASEDNDASSKGFSQSTNSKKVEEPKAEKKSSSSFRRKKKEQKDDDDDI